MHNEEAVDTLTGSSDRLLVEVVGQEQTLIFE